MKLAKFFFQLGSVFNIVKPLPSPSLKKHFIQSDTKALQEDWVKVGEAMNHVLGVNGHTQDAKNINEADRKEVEVNDNKSKRVNKRI